MQGHAWQVEAGLSRILIAADLGARNHVLTDAGKRSPASFTRRNSLLRVLPHRSLPSLRGGCPPATPPGRDIASPPPAGLLLRWVPIPLEPPPDPDENECFRLPGDGRLPGVSPPQSTILGRWGLDRGYGFLAYT